MSEQEHSHNDIYKAIGVLSSTTEAIKHELHLMRVDQATAEARRVQEILDLREDHLAYGRRIANLEKINQWVKGLAVGIVILSGLLATNIGEFLQKWFNIK